MGVEMSVTVVLTFQMGPKGCVPDTSFLARRLPAHTKKMSRRSSKTLARRTRSGAPSPTFLTTRY